jgi:hypothetical protein
MDSPAIARAGVRSGDSDVQVRISRSDGPGDDLAAGEVNLPKLRLCRPMSATARQFTSNLVAKRHDGISNSDQGR